ncbi:MAG TPA: hypothetical protein VL501_03895, partial [Pyrinomonadaceae bacterium]|nr:hypothetical protein [Pyrinomonadaceae bacterium]
MKRCPECRRDYYDDSLMYCLEDGAALLQGSVPPPEEPQTQILPEIGEAAPRAQLAATAELNDAAKTTSEKKTIPLIPALLGILLVMALGTAGYWIYGRDASKQIESIAVMPFVNASGDANVDYLSDG